ncbi:MAG: hypothetical protein P4L45_10070 [Ignavibacteriaceae bacterium]|nr:hypothetical protein [Ignavibacteriaceae bacterium]
MKIESFSQKINIPNIKEFGEKYPQFLNLAQNDGKFLFDLIMTPQTFISSKELSDYGYPAVLSVANKCYQASVQKKGFVFNNHVKQFIGAAICNLMENNSYIKTGIKKSIPHPSFSRGEFYKTV